MNTPTYETHTKNWGGAGFALLLLLFTASDAFAQATTRYIDPESGSGTACTRSAPCQLVEAYKLTNADDTNFLILVPFTGGTVEVIPPGSANKLTEKVRFGTYVQGSDAAVEGTIRFVRPSGGESQPFLIAPSGQVRLNAKASVEFGDVAVDARGLNDADDFFNTGNGEQNRITITGTLTLYVSGDNAARIGYLVVSRDMTIEAGNRNGASLLIAGGLTVKEGATLTLRRKNRNGKGVVLEFFFRKGSTSTAPEGLLTVDGTIKGHSKGDARISTTYLGKNNRASIKPRIPTSAYDPSNGVDHTDCVRIAGKGTIQNVVFRMIALGNVCVDLKQVDDLQVFGSIVEPSGVTEDSISTDVIFRSEVIVEGNIEQWGDARMVFEKKATIQGNVNLYDGTYPTDILAADFGERRAGSVRRGVQIGGKGKYSCVYAPRGPDGKDNKKRGMHIPGMQFEDAVTIMGNLKVNYSSFTDGAAADTKPTAPACAPRVLFLAPLSGANTRESVIMGTLSIKDVADFADKGRVHLDADTTGASLAKRPKTVHNVRVEGGISAWGNTIGMGYASTSNMDGMCTGKDTRLTFGNHIVLAGTKSQVISGQGSVLMLDALVVLGDTDVERGPLTVKTLHVGPRAELMSTKDVKVTESLLLQGELSGELDEASTIKRLTYGNRNTDVVKKAALADTLDALAIHIGSGELRLDEVVKTENLGLCSGTLSLADAESTTDSTLYVTEHITVQNGMLEKDANDPGSISTDKAKTANINDRYILTYITPGKRTVTDALEWFDPRDVIVNHASAEITTSGDRSIVGKLMITKGKLMVDGMLTVGTSTLHLTDATEVGRYSVEVAAGELHTEGQDVRVHGKVSVNGKSKLMTGGGDLHVLGRVNKGAYTSETAHLTLAKEAIINLGAGTLMLGPADTAKRDGRVDDDKSLAQVDMVLQGQLIADTLYVPGGSKRTHIISKMSATAHTNTLGVVLFDGSKTPNDQLANNAHGKLLFNWIKASGTDTGTTTVLDSIGVMEGGRVEFYGTSFLIMKEVHMRSGRINTKLETLEFKDHVRISGTGKLDFSGTGTSPRVLVAGNYVQTNDTGIESWRHFPGTGMGEQITKTVMGDLVVGEDTPYSATRKSNLILHGDLHFNYTYDFRRYGRRNQLNAALEFKGTEPQEVRLSSDPKVELGNVTVNNPKGIVLGSQVRQLAEATLTLRQGKIRSIPGDTTYQWVIRNVQGEQEIRGRSSAQEGEKCGADNDEECKATILRGSRQSYVATPVVRHLLQGVSGAGFASGGYLFPVGMDHKTDQDTLSHYRPLILQLPSDLTDTTAATVSPVMVPDGAMPAWQNLTVPTAGGSLTLDVHADLFWKVDLGTESLPTNTNIRLAAAGLRNVADASGLRIVQWDCMWENPKLAGRVPAQADAESFAVNGYLNGVVNLTQEGIGLGSCAIFGVAANGIENPIDQADLSGGRANLQFIHNVPLLAPIDLHLGDIQIGSGMQFRSATAYRPVGAGSHDLKIQPAGAPAGQAITSTLSLNPNTNTVVIAHGSLAEPMLKVLKTRMTSRVANQVEVLLVHGSADLGAARVDVMDPIDPMTVERTLAGNLMLDKETRYTSLNPSQQVFRVKSTDGELTEFYEMNLFGYKNQTLVLNLSGMRNDLTILGVDKNGEIVPVQMVTGVGESAELPTEFALHGNYPNPFNPSTRIQFDLPERAQVSIQIVDMLGREVITLPAQEMEAGANRSLELHASSLASGTYLYRLIAKGAEHRHVKTGRMTLVK